MSNHRATLSITRFSMSFLMALAAAPVALNMASTPLGMAAANATAAGPIAAVMDHGVIGADAVATGDVETVEMSIAAYDRVSIAADDRVSIAADDRSPELAPSR